MKIIEVNKFEINEKELFGKQAVEKGNWTEIHDDCIVTHEGVPIFAYGDAPNDVQFWNWCKEFTFPRPQRKNGGQGTILDFGDKDRLEETYFGYRVARPIYNVPPGLTQQSQQSKDAYHHILKGEEFLADKFKKMLPKYYAEHVRIIEAVNKRWRMNGSLWTQSVVNKGNQHPYHYDRDNIPNTMNGMICHSYGMIGGNTVVPMFRLKFIMQRSKFLIFMAQNILHAVTPMKKIAPDSGRFSTVYYAHKGTLKMGTMKEELEKFKLCVDLRLDPKNKKIREERIIKSRRKDTRLAINKNAALKDKK
jgi:hypothetical protein